MGAAPVLIMLAAIGVDYGWQPDGTTSSRGDNIEYIVQISPDQLQQLRSIGEITSSIDPSVQGRVSRIVVKIGSDTLPKNAGRVAVKPTATQATKNQTVQAGTGDDQLVPIPEIPRANVAAANTGNSLRGTAATAPNAAVMKPDPQGSGFSMPDGTQAGAQSALDQVRSRAAESANQMGAQTRAAFDPQQNSLTQGAVDAAGRATNALQNGYNTLTNPNAARTNNVVSTDPATGRDNRWENLAARNAASPGLTGGPSTDPVDPSTRSSAWPGIAQTSDPRSLGNQNPNTVSPYGTDANSNQNTLARDPNDPKWSGYGTSPNFGAYPGSTNVPRTGYEAQDQYGTSPTTNGLADPRYSATNPNNTSGYTQDAQGIWRDSLGRAVDSNGQLIDINATTANTYNSVYNNGQQKDKFGNLLDNTGHPIDKYGRKIDIYGNLLSDTRLAQTTDPRSATNPQYAAPRGYGSPTYPANTTYGSSNQYPATAADRFGNANPYDPTAYSRTSYPQSSYGANTTAAQYAATQNQMRGYPQQGTFNSQTRPLNYEDGIGSASDLRTAAGQLAAKAERDRILAIKARNITAQPFFIVVLLISLVGNAYLIFETNNLRRKFRNMIGSVRSSMVTALPAT